MRSSEKLDQLLPALAKARPNFGEITKTQTNLHFGKPYADLSDILPQVIPALAAEGLLLLGTMEPHESGGVLVTERLMHVSEQYLECLILLSYPAGQLQKLGGDITYFRRYADNTMLALSADQDLDDARPEEPIADRRPARKPAPKPVVQVETAPAPMHLNGAETPAPTGKPTKELVSELIKLMQETYGTPETVNTLIRHAVQPRGQTWTDFRCRTQMTQEQYQQLWDDAVRVAKQQAAETTGTEADDPDVPLTPGPESPPVPQAEISPTGEGGEPLNVPTAPQEAVSRLDGADPIDIDADDPPDVGLGTDELVPLAFMPALWERAEKSGNRLLLRSILKDAEQVTMGQYYFAWVQVGPKPAKV